MTEYRLGDKVMWSLTGESGEIFDVSNYHDTEVYEVEIAPGDRVLLTREEINPA